MELGQAGIRALQRPTASSRTKSHSTFHPFVRWTVAKSSSSMVDFMTVISSIRSVNVGNDETHNDGNQYQNRKTVLTLEVYQTTFGSVPIVILFLF
jgi:hypothetical protein